MRVSVPDSFLETFNSLPSNSIIVLNSAWCIAAGSDPALITSAFSKIYLPLIFSALSCAKEVIETKSKKVSVKLMCSACFISSVLFVDLKVEKKSAPCKLWFLNVLLYPPGRSWRYPQQQRSASPEFSDLYPRAY